MEEKKKNDENRFWLEFFLGACLGAGVVYFLQENNPDKKEQLIQIIRDLLNENDHPSPATKMTPVSFSSPSKSERIFRRNGKKLK